MKRILLLCVAVFTLIATLNAQSKKFVLFEHFTQASCGPCATQNPSFEAVKAQNLSNVHHISYHTSWPGVDPMNAINPAPVQDRVDYYGVSGVPSMHIGKLWSGQPGSVSTALINSATNASAPVELDVEHLDLGDGNFMAKVIVNETGDLPTSQLRLRIALVEKEINYTSAPGNNGEREFPNVFREMLTTTEGLLFSPTGAGTSQTLDFMFESRSEYNEEELYVIAWLQEEPSGTIVNSGSSIDPNWQLVNNSMNTTSGGTESHIFEANYSSKEETESLLVTVITDAPDDWSYELAFNDTEINADEQVEVMVNATDVIFQLTVNPGSTGAIANYAIKIESVEFPLDQPATVNYSVISNITDLVVDHGGVATQFNSMYIDGLRAANNINVGVLPLTSLRAAWDSGYLESVNNIYDNISWTFPGLMNDEVALLSDFLDNGGNLFINGQDIGWDTWDANTAANGTPQTQAFYTDYLSANYIGDGSAADNSLTFIDDEVFIDIESTVILDVHGGNIYPDQINPIEPAVSIYHYGNNVNKSGAIRVEEDGHKVVYLGVDMGMIADEDVRLAIISTSHDWFYGLLSNAEYDEKIKQALGQNYPNPAHQFTTIPFTSLEKNADIIVVDLNGNIVHQGKVTQGDTAYELSLENLASGSYYYYLRTQEGQSIPKKIQVLK